MSDETKGQEPKKIAFKDLSDNAKDKLDDAIWEIKHSRLGYRIHDRRWSIQESFENDFKGYCDADVVNLGDRLVEHYAELLAYLSEQTYEHVDLDWFDKLRPIAESFNAYSDVVEELGTIGRLSRIGTKKEDYNPPIVSNTYETLKSKFQNEWHWVGENILTEKFSMPEGLSTPKPANEIRVRSYYKTVAENIAGGLKGIGVAIGRHTSPNSFSRRDIAAMPYSELERTSALLYDFARSTFSHPHEYHGSGSELKERDENWKEKQALAASLLGNHEVADSIIHEHNEDGTVGIAKNGKDPDWAAWIEDVTYAADVILTWKEWIEPSGLREKMQKTGALQDQIAEFDEKIRAEFLDVWDWIGDNVDGLWI